MLRRSSARATMWLATLILLAAALLRLTDITTLAHGLHYDEAAYVLNIRDIAYHGDRPIFVRAFVGREVGFLYWAAPWLIMAGDATWGIRLASAMLSLIGVAATFSLTRSLFAKHPQRDTIALIAALWLAVSIAPLIFGRYVYRAGSQPVVQALALMALWRGMNTGRWRWFVAAGVFLGLVAYTYLAARLFPIPVAVALLTWLALPAQLGRGPRLARVGVMGLVAALVFAPLGWFFIQNPDIFAARLDQVSGSAGWREVAWAWWQCWRGLFLPSFGDPNVRYNLPDVPVSGEIFSLFGLIGVIALFIPHKKTSEVLKTSEVYTHPATTSKNLKTSEIYATRALLLSGLVVMLVPSALAVKDIVPSNIRMIGVWTFLAPVIGYGGVTLWNMASRLLKIRPIHPRWLQIGLIGALLATSLSAWSRYSRWNHSLDLFVATDGNMTVIGQDLQRRSDANLKNTSLYVASIHYQSPTVAALTQRFAQVKWLTGGGGPVPAPKGDGVDFLPPFVAGS
ncbi:MAG: glycosyltransferase family 39 protein [Anaerolineae bacterium]|nr:glycosyltransferase family 39 protein [Anaerolineae bacterium]